MARTVAEELAHVGVERVYGIVGDSLNPVTDAIRRSGTAAITARRCRPPPNFHTSCTRPSSTRSPSAASR
jgi:hypothetical protein